MSGLTWRLSGLCLCTRRKPSARELREREDEAQWEAYDQSPGQTASNGSKPAIELVSWARSPPQPPLSGSPHGSPFGPPEPFHPATLGRPPTEYPRESHRPWTSRLPSVLSFGRGRQQAETRYDDDPPPTGYDAPQTVYDDERPGPPRTTWQGDGSPTRDFTTLRPSHSPSNGPLPRARQPSSRRAPTEYESYRPRTATETYAPRSGDQPRETEYTDAYRSRAQTFADRPSTFRSRTGPVRTYRDDSYRPETEVTERQRRPSGRDRMTPSRSMSDVRTTYAPRRGASFASSLPRRFSSVFGRPSDRR